MLGKKVILDTIQFYLQQYPILQFMASLLAVALLASFILWLFRKVIQRNLERTHKYVQERIVIKLETPITLIILLAGSEIALRQLITGQLGFKIIVDSSEII